VRTPDSEDEFFELIYRDLTLLGFKTGTPDRILYPDVYDAFLSELKRCVALVHVAGVIHVDLYASNIMWAQDSDGSVRIKIVDWDVSHCLEEGDFFPKIRDLISSRAYAGNSLVPLFGKAHDLNYVSVYEMPVEDRHYSEWKALASGEKNLIDPAFRSLMEGRMK
jgi:hypothetical protein